MSFTINSCTCGDAGAGQNYGLSNCQVGIDVAEDAYFMSVTKAAGGTNGIQTGDTLDQAFFDSKFKAGVFADRWFPIKGIEDVQSPPVDSKKKEYPSGRTVILSKGIVMTSFTVPVADPNKFGKKIEARKCLTDQGIMYKDRSKSLVGQTVVGDTGFGPIKIIDGTLDVQVFPLTDEDDPHVIISFQHSRETAITDADFIESASMTYNLDDARALNDVNITFTGFTINALSFTVKDDWAGYNVGASGGGVPAGGLLALIDIFNNSALAVEPATITEPTAGNYVATYTTPISIGNIVEVRGIGGTLADYVTPDFDLKRFINATATTA